MESLVTWYAENGSALWTTIIAFLSAKLLTIVFFVIKYVQAKLSTIKSGEKLVDTLEKLKDDILAIVEANKADIIAACDSNTLKRIEAIKELSDNTKQANEELEEADPVDVASSILENAE